MTWEGLLPLCQGNRSCPHLAWCLAVVGTQRIRPTFRTCVLFACRVWIHQGTYQRRPRSPERSL